MHLGTIVFIGIAVNLDNLCLGLSCGIAKKHIPWYHNLIIALVSGIFGGLACALAHLIPDEFSKTSALAGALILFASGAWALAQGLNKHDDAADLSCRFTSLREVCILSIALALNCLAVSFGIGMTSASPLLLGISMTIFSFIGVGIGNRLGKKAACLIKPSLLDIISGLMLMALAVWQWLG